MIRRLLLLLLAALVLGDVIGRRLLMGGGGSFPNPVAPLISNIESPGEGGWVWFGARRAIRSGNETITGFITGTAGGDVKAIRIDNDTRSVLQTTALYNNFIVDDHSPPSFVVRPDGIIMSAFAYHVGELYVGIGPSVGVLPAQANVTNITSQATGGGPVTPGSVGYTYASIVYVSAETRYYIFVRYHASGGTPYLVETHSDNGGVTWSAHTIIQQITYHQFAQNGANRLDFVVSDHPLYGQGDNPAVKTSIYHLYYDGTWHKSDGSALTPTIGNTAATLVYDGTTSRAWLWDIAIGVDGHPRIVYVVYNETFPSGAWNYKWARWTGAAWSNHQVAGAGGTITVGATPEHGQDYAGGIVLDHQDPNVVWYSSDAGGSFQVYRSVTADNGATWAPTAMTSDADKNVRPVSVVGHDGRIEALWLYGTYTDYFNYSQGIKGAG